MYTYVLSLFYMNAILQLKVYFKARHGGLVLRTLKWEDQEFGASQPDLKG